MALEVRVPVPLLDLGDMPVLLAVEDRCPAIPTLRRAERPPGWTAEARTRVLSDEALADMRFCAVWFALQDAGTMELSRLEPWVRLEVERARPVYAARAEDTFDLDAAGRAAYLGAVLDLALDRGAGLVQMRAFVESYPDDAHVPDAWLWLGDAWAAACGGSW